MLESSTLSTLQEGKNLLAFSAGVDSTALFFLLLDASIEFDIAIVNYHTRASSTHEVNYAMQLARTYNKQLYIHDATLQDSNYEQEARSIRYDFFQTLIKEHTYTTLLTAHQLNDQLEWFLMQLTKGAGSLELLGMQALTQKENYTLIRPLLQQTKESLENYLKSHNRNYFIDESNHDQKHKRNYFRHTFSDKLLQEHAKGIQESFNYLHEDAKLILKGSSITQHKELYVIKAQNHRAILFHADKIFKQLGIVLSSKERLSITPQCSLVLSHKYVVETNHNYLFITPVCNTKIPKKEKENFRRSDVPTKIRPYLYKESIKLDDFL